MELPLFPLRTVLFPGGRLPLRVFEQRYLEMTKKALRDDSPFGVCLITRGGEVAGEDRSAPEIADVGTVARIVRWDMPQLGILELVAQGAERFRVTRRWTTASGLVVGDVEGLPPEPAASVGDDHRDAAGFLKTVISRVGSEQFPEPVRLDDASWVGYRLAELLPIPLGAKQGMLEMSDSDARLSLLAQVLRRNDLL